MLRSNLSKKSVFAEAMCMRMQQVQISTDYYHLGHLNPTFGAYLTRQDLPAIAY